MGLLMADDTNTEKREKEEQDSVRELAQKISSENSEVLKKLAEGPHGEYQHQLEERLAEALAEVRRLRKENMKLKSLIRVLDESN
jgi:gas vesicle protein